MYWHLKLFTLIFGLFLEGLLHFHPREFVGLLVTAQLPHYVVHIYVGFAAFTFRHCLDGSLNANFGCRQCFLLDNFAVKFLIFKITSQICSGLLYPICRFCHWSIVSRGGHQKEKHGQIAPSVRITTRWVKSEVFGGLSRTGLLFLFLLVIIIIILVNDLLLVCFACFKFFSRCGGSWGGLFLRAKSKGRFGKALIKVLECLLWLLHLHVIVSKVKIEVGKGHLRK